MIGNSIGVVLIVFTLWVGYKLLKNDPDGNLLPRFNTNQLPLAFQISWAELWLRRQPWRLITLFRMVLDLDERCDLLDMRGKKLEDLRREAWNHYRCAGSIEARWRLNTEDTIGGRLITRREQRLDHICNTAVANWLQDHIAKLETAR